MANHYGTTTNDEPLDQPADEYLLFGFIDVPAGKILEIPAGRQMVIFGPLTGDGFITGDGDLVVA